VDDAEEFEFTIGAMRTIGIPNEDINTSLNVVAATLLLGNTKFQVDKDNSEGCTVLEEGADLSLACELLGVEVSALSTALTTKTITTRAETYVSPISASQAGDYRDALARQLYGLLFLRLVDRTNRSIGYLDSVSLFCGVLDIFGFECFRTNSFEQLCINFTNERLQQFFNTFVFKLEEELYKREEIPWDPLDFPDNQESVDLLADPRSGIFAMLDEECMVPQGSDKGFCNKIISKYSTSHSRFDVIKTRPDWFVIKHFAGPVSYASEGFLEKNKDQLSVPIYEVMKGSTNAFIASLFIEQELKRVEIAPSPPAKRESLDGPMRKKKFLSVSTEFKDQLQELMDSVTRTEPHFIRCIKPNPQNLPDVYDRPSVCEQLRYGGVLQAVQVSRAGYPVRINHESFWLDFRHLIKERKLSTDPRSRALDLMKELEVQLAIPRHAITNSISWAVGKSLVFLKHEAFERVQSARLALRNACATRIQARYRAWVGRKEFLATRTRIIKIQSVWRGKLARLHAAQERRIKAAVFIQSVVRMAVQKAQFNRTRAAAVRIQARWRGLLARRKFATMRVDLAAAKIQSVWRGYTVRKMYTIVHRGILEIQRHWRMRSAKMQLRRLKQEAKEVGSLLSKYQSAVAELHDVGKRNCELVDGKMVLFRKVESLEEELKLARIHITGLESDIAVLKEKLAKAELEKSLYIPPLMDDGKSSTPPFPAETVSGPISRASPGGSPVAASTVTSALDSFKAWLGGSVKPSGSKMFAGGVLQSSLKGTKSMKAACKDPESMSDLRPVQELQDGESAVTCICFGQEKIHKGYILLAAASKDGNVVIYRCYRTELERLSLNEAEFPKEENQAPPPSEHGNIVVHCRLTGHTRAITSLFFSLLEDMVVTTSIDKSVRFWNADTGEMLKVFTDSSPVPVACFLPFNPSVFVAANSNAVLRLVNATNGMVLQKLKVEAEVRALKFDDTGLFLLAGTKNGSVHVLEACDNATLRFKFKLQLARGGITCITFVSAKENQPPCLLVNSSDSTVTIVDCIYGPPGSTLINLNVRHRVKVAHSLLPLKCCFSPSDQGYLVSGSEDKGVYVFSLAKGSNYKMQVLNHHQVPVVAVACNSQDTLLASADSLGRIVLWRRLDFSHMVQWQPTQVVSSQTPSY
jgi:WD40 repeat protein